MTLPNRRLSLEEVLDQFFFSADTPAPAMVLRACEAHPEHRQDILEFAALWSSYDASPEPTNVGAVSEDSVARVQSFVLNRLHELDVKPVSETDVAAARAAVAGLAGGRLKRAAAAAGLGESALLLTKVLTKRITDVPSKVLNDLARHLNVAASALLQCLGLKLAGNMRYKSSAPPNAPATESWDSAVRALPVSADEKRRLLALQGKEDAP
jgi:hypothetical protein